MQREILSPVIMSICCTHCLYMMLQPPISCDRRNGRSGYCGYQKAMAETAEAVTMSIIPKGRLRHFGLRLMLASGVTTCLPLSCCIYLLAAAADYYSARCGRSGLA